MEALMRASPSSRRAWVEIPQNKTKTPPCHTVALLTEGVGRNNDGLYQYPTPDRRPPHGGRG